MPVSLASFAGVAEDPVGQGGPADFALVIENLFAEYADDFFKNVFFLEELMRYGVGVDDGTAELCQLSGNGAFAGIHSAKDANHRFFSASCPQKPQSIIYPRNSQAILKCRKNFR